jgi:hypothetical protein
MNNKIVSKYIFIYIYMSLLLFKYIIMALNIQNILHNFKSQRHHGIHVAFDNLVLVSLKL